MSAPCIFNNRHSFPRLCELGSCATSTAITTRPPTPFTRSSLWAGCTCMMYAVSVYICTTWYRQACGWPATVHGGLIASIVDESFGGLMMCLIRNRVISGWRPSYTVQLDVTYKQVGHQYNSHASEKNPMRRRHAGHAVWSMLLRHVSSQRMPHNRTIICASSLQEAKDRKTWFTAGAKRRAPLCTSCSLQRCLTRRQAAPMPRPRRCLLRPGCARWCRTSRRR